MKTFKVVFMICLFSSLAMANVQQGRIIQKIDSHKAEIDLRGLQAGDRVNLLEQVCEGPKVKLCRTEKVGTAVVSKVINAETSEIKVEGPHSLEKHFLIEKQ